MASEAVFHESVMVREVLDALRLRPGDVAADGTLGLGGHTRRFAEAVRPGGRVLATDWDTQMLAVARDRLADVTDVQLDLHHADFRTLPGLLEAAGVRARGVLLDLGLNSAQVEDPSRGIAFKNAGPLDMRMDQTRGEPASALLNRWSPDEIERVLWDLGDERWARAIARKIVERRKTAPLRTTDDLVECVLAAVPVKARDKRIHPATRTFQAVRIAVNHELEELEEAIEGIAENLAPEGTLVVLSYHSGEDRIVKRAFRSMDGDEFKDLYRKPLEPTPEEVASNPRSRSARMRALRRMPT